MNWNTYSASALDSMELLCRIELCHFRIEDGAIYQPTQRLCCRMYNVLN